MNRKDIIFIPLQSSHFPLLLKWLETPHVKAWWDPAIQWNPQAIEEKYASYVRGYKRLILKEQVIEKPMNAFIIQVQGQDIGYIQYYNKHDFPPEQGDERMGLPASCAAFDMYIGEAEFVGKGWGAKVLHLFLEEHIFKKFEYVFVDPDTANLPAIKAYEKAGFKPLGKEENNPIPQMIKDKSLFHTIQRLEFSLLKTQMRHNPAYLAMLIEDTFIEIGKSGRVYNKKDILTFLPGETPRQITVQDFQIKEISDEVILALYTTIETNEKSLRSSLWHKTSTGWQMTFHQGTLCLDKLSLKG